MFFFLNLCSHFSFLFVRPFNEFYQFLLWWQKFEDIGLYLVSSLVGGYTHWLEEVLHDVVDVLLVHVLAENNADRCVFALTAVIVVENTQVAAELGEISDFEVTLLQFEHHGTAKVTVVEEEVYPVVVTEFVIVNLIADEGEALAEGHDEVFDVVHDVLLYDAVIDVLVTHTEFLNIDEVYQVVILEHLDGTESLLVVGDGGKEIIGELALVVVEVTS